MIWSEQADDKVDPVLWFYAMAFVGLPYKWGGDDTIEGFDCSGLCIEIYQSAGLLPNKFDTTAQGLYDRYSNPSHGSLAARPEFGSLVYYGKSRSDIGHVAFCLSSTKILTASGGDNSTINIHDAARDNAFVKVRPIDYRRDFVAATHPHGGLFL